MAKKKKPADDDAKGGSKVKVIGLAVGFAVLGAVLGPKLLGGGGAPAAAAGETTTTTEAAGPVITLDAITLNLADGHLLQVGLAFELDAEHATGGGGHGAAPSEDDPTKGYAKAIDATISTLGEQTMAALSAPGGREAAKAELTAVLAELYHGEIAEVYFHQFVMQ